MKTGANFWEVWLSVGRNECASTNKSEWLSLCFDCWGHSAAFAQPLSLPVTLSWNSKISKLFTPCKKNPVSLVLR